MFYASTYLPALHVKNPLQSRLLKFQMSDHLQIRRLTSRALMPAKATKNAAGFDLYSPYNYSIPQFGKGLIVTDLQVF